MRFHIGAIPSNPHFHPEAEGWKKIREPRFLIFLLMALPVAVLIVVGVISAFSTIDDPSARIVVRAGTIHWFTLVGVVLTIVAGFIGLILVHEALHVAGFPGFGLTQDTIIGVWPSRFIAYAYYGGEITRRRFIMAIALPILVLTILPVAACVFAQRLPIWIGFVALLNGISSCFDLLVIGIVMMMTPPGAILRNNGWETYWRLPNPRRGD